MRDIGARSTAHGISKTRAPKVPRALRFRASQAGAKNQTLWSAGYLQAALEALIASC